MKQLRCDFADTFTAAQNRHPDGMLRVQTQCQIFKHTAVRIIQVHTDLLIDDAHFLLYAFFRKIWGGYKFQQQLQGRLKILRAGDIIGGHIIAGEGIGAGAQSRQFCGNIPVTGQIKHFMLQKMGNSRRNMDFLTFQRKIRVDRPKVCHEIGQLSGKAGSLVHHNGQTIGQPFLIKVFSQTGICFHIHACTPFRK